jgi:ribosomal protein RSM22 (predicted rRNA methylase)
MSTPGALSDALAAIDAVPGLAMAVERLSQRYHAGVVDGERALRDDLDRQAYVAARMPATSAAVSAALGRCRDALTSATSVLDLGSGPGSALWAVAEHGPRVARFTAVERDADLIAHGRRLAAHHAALAATTWIAADLRRLPAIDPHDLVVLSYVTNEIDDAARAALITQAWALTRVALLVVEPGTPRGFSACLEARTTVLAHGAHLAAPCPSAHVCPWAEADDRWCHFRVRVARSRLHRAAKGGALGYEDEPYSFVCATRTPLPTIAARVVSTPKVHRGAVDLTLCTAEGITPLTIPRRDRQRYDAAAEFTWGDHLDSLP